MIQIEELRVGNIVNSPNGAIEIDSIFVMGLFKNKKLYGVTGESNPYGCPISSITPVEINALNLIELGFKRDGPYLTYGDDPQITVTPDAEVRIGDYKEVQVLINPPLHQLQNLITDLK